MPIATRRSTRKTASSKTADEPLLKTSEDESAEKQVSDSNTAPLSHNNVQLDHQQGESQAVFQSAPLSDSSVLPNSQQSESNAVDISLPPRSAKKKSSKARRGKKGTKRVSSLYVDSVSKSAEEHDRGEGESPPKSKKLKADSSHETEEDHILSFGEFIDSPNTVNSAVSENVEEEDDDDLARAMAQVQKVKEDQFPDLPVYKFGPNENLTKFETVNRTVFEGILRTVEHLEMRKGRTLDELITVSRVEKPFYDDLDSYCNHEAKCHTNFNPEEREQQGREETRTVVFLTAFKGLNPFTGSPAQALARVIHYLVAQERFFDTGDCCENLFLISAANVALNTALKMLRLGLASRPKHLRDFWKRLPQEDREYLVAQEKYFKVPETEEERLIRYENEKHRDQLAKIEQERTKLLNLEERIMQKAWDLEMGKLPDVLRSHYNRPDDIKIFDHKTRKSIPLKELRRKASIGFQKYLFRMEKLKHEAAEKEKEVEEILKEREREAERDRLRREAMVAPDPMDYVREIRNCGKSITPSGQRLNFQLQKGRENPQGSLPLKEQVSDSRDSPSPIGLGRDNYDDDFLDQGGDDFNFDDDGGIDVHPQSDDEVDQNPLNVSMRQEDGSNKNPNVLVKLESIPTVGFCEPNTKEFKSVLDFVRNCENLNQELRIKQWPNKLVTAINLQYRYTFDICDKTDGSKDTDWQTQSASELRLTLERMSESAQRTTSSQSKDLLEEFRTWLSNRKLKINWAFKENPIKHPVMKDLVDILSQFDNLLIQSKRKALSDSEQKLLVKTLSKEIVHENISKEGRAQMKSAIDGGLNELKDFTLAVERVSDIVMKQLKTLFNAAAFTGTQPTNHQQAGGQKRKESSSSSNNPNTSSAKKSKPSPSAKTERKGNIRCRGCGWDLKRKEPNGKLFCPRNSFAGCRKDPRRNTSDKSWVDSEVGKKWSKFSKRGLPGDETITLQNVSERYAKNKESKSSN